MDEITDQPLEKCLMKLAFDSDKVELETLMHKEAMKQMG
jgi:hypothetical protein